VLSDSDRQNLARIVYARLPADRRRAMLAPSFPAVCGAISDAAVVGEWGFVRSNLVDLVLIGSAVEMIRPRPTGPTAIQAAIDDWYGALRFATEQLRWNHPVARDPH